jgi:hypothetical protein
MANKQRIDSIIDVPSIQQEQQKTISLLADIRKYMDDMGQVKLNLKGAETLTAAKQASLDARSAIASLVDTLNKYEQVQQRIADNYKQVSGATAQNTDVTKRSTDATLQNTKSVVDNERAKQAKLKTEQLEQKVEQEGLKTKKLKTQEDEKAQKLSSKEQKDINDLSNDYKQLSIAYSDAALRAKNLALQQGSNSPAAKAAFAEANALGNKLKEVDALAGQYQRNVGNYSSAFTGYANTLRGLRGPTKLLGEALGIGAMEADQFRLILEHAFQGIATFFRGKEAKAEAEREGAAATEESTAATEANVTATEERVATEAELTAAINARAAAERRASNIAPAEAALQEVSAITPASNPVTPIQSTAPAAPNVAPVASEAATTAETANSAAMGANTELTTANTAAHEANNTILTQGAAAEAEITTAALANSEAMAVNSVALAENTVQAEANVAAAIENAVALESTAVAVEANAAALETNAVALEANAVGLQGISASALEATTAETGLTVATSNNVAATQLSIVTTNEAAVTQEAFAVATTATSTALKIFRIALMATGIGVVIGLIALVVYQMKEYNKRIAEATKDTKLMSDVTTKAAESYGKERAELEVLVASLKNEHIPRKEKLELLKQLQDKYPGYFDDIKTEKDLIDKLPAAYEKAAQGILLKAKVEAAQTMIGDNYKKQLEAEGKYYESVGKAGAALKDNLKNFSFGDKGRTNEFLKSYKGQLDIFVTDYKTTVDEVGQQNKRLLDFVLKSNDQIEGLGGKITKPKKEHDKDEKDYLADSLKAKKEADKLYYDSIAELYKSIETDEKNSIGVRLEALADFHSTRLKAIEVEKNDELAIIDEKTKDDLAKHGLTEKQKHDILATQAAERLKVETDYYKNLQNIRLADAKEELDLRMKMFSGKDVDKKSLTDIENTAKRAYEINRTLQDMTVAGLKETSDIQLANIQSSVNARQEALAKEYSQGKISRNEYENALLGIQRTAAKESLDIQIKELEKEIKLMEIGSKARRDAEVQLSDLKKKLAQGAVGDGIASDNSELKEKLDNITAFLLDVQKVSAKVFDVIGGAIDANVARQKNAIQEIEAERDKAYKNEVDRINSSTLSEQDKANKLKILEATRNTQKEQAAQKERELDERKAKFDKARNIANIVLETALSVVHQLGSGDPYTAIPRAVAVGVLGAAQLAVAIATPIPKFATGTQSSPQGFAIVGEQGHEVTKSPSGKVALTPDKPTLTYLEKGTKVIPNNKLDSKTLQILKATLGENPAPVIPANDKQELVKALQNLPKFAVGTSSSPEGAAWVGEQGAELYKTPSGEMGFTPSIPTLTWLDKGTEIIPHDKVDDALYKLMLQQTAGALHMNMSKPDNGMERLERSQELQFDRLIKAVKDNRPVVKVINKDAGFHSHISNQVYK